MSDGKVPLVEKFEASAARCDAHDYGHTGNCRCYKAYRDCAAQLEQFWPLIERLIAAGEVMRKHYNGVKKDQFGVIQPEKGTDAYEWDSALAAYQAGRNGK
jgi:hypothetical protein